MLVLASLLAGAASAGAAAQTFPLTADELGRRFNAVVRADGGDPIRECRRSVQGPLACAFGRAWFRRSLALYRRMGVAYGPADPGLVLRIDEEGGKVARVALTGRNDDPVVLTAYAAEAGALLRALDPSLSSAGATQQTVRLGLMGGGAPAVVGGTHDQGRGMLGAQCGNPTAINPTIITCVFEPHDAMFGFGARW